MVVQTKIFGEILIEDDKIITLERGIIGFPDLKRFALVHNADKPEAKIAWLVSMDEPAFALPVIDPLVIYETYNPVVDDEMLKPIGNLDPNEMLVLVTVSVPKDDPKGMTANLKAPLIINAVERKACQIILEGDEYKIKYPVFDLLEVLKRKGGK